MSTQEESKIIKFLKLIDLFSYIPVPQAYPVSTSKSRAGSVAVILLLVGYLIYDFYLFLTKSFPTLNVYQSSFVNKGTSLLPQIAFGMKYADLQNDQEFIVNSSYYFTFKLYAGIVQSSSLNMLSSRQNLVQVDMQPCAQGTWANRISANLTCPYFSFPTAQQLNAVTWSVDNNGNLMMSSQLVNNTIMSMILILQLIICTDPTCAQTPQQIIQFLKFSQFIIYTNQLTSFDYAQAKPIILPFPQNIQFYVTYIDYDNLIISFFQCTTLNFIMTPNYLTTFTKNSYNFTRISQGKSYTFYYSPKDLLARFTLRPRITMDVVQVHFQTIITRLSTWSALVSFIFFLAAFCFLGYNQRKFNKKNPQWKNFDKIFKQKITIQMQNYNKSIGQNSFNDRLNQQNKQN